MQYIFLTKFMFSVLSSSGSSSISIHTAGVRESLELVREVVARLSTCDVVLVVTERGVSIDGADDPGYPPNLLQS